MTGRCLVNKQKSPHPLPLLVYSPTPVVRLTSPSHSVLQIPYLSDGPSPRCYDLRSYVSDMGKPSQYPPGPITTSCLEGREQFRKAFKAFSRQWSQPQLMKLATAALKDNVIHSSQITGFATGTLKDPAPKVLYALGLFNEALAQGDLPQAMAEAWKDKEVMRTSSGGVMGPAEMFMAFVGALDLGLSNAKEIPLEFEESVSAVFGKWVRLTLASKGVDFVVEDHQRLVEAAASFKGLLAGKTVKGEELVKDLPVIAAELGVEEGECWDVIQEHLHTITSTTTTG